MLNRQRQNHSLHWKMKLPDFFFRSKLIQPWTRLQRWQICSHLRPSLYIKSNRLTWVFIQLLCNYELSKADLSRRCSSYDLLKTCMKVFSYRSSCVLHSEKRQQNVKVISWLKIRKIFHLLLIFWKKILSSIWIKWESGYDIIWGQVWVQNGEKWREVEVKDMKNVWWEEVKEEKSGNDAFYCHVLYL